jgi:hypothetical protein
VGYVACTGDGNTSFTENIEGQRPLGRHGCSWEDDIKTDIKETNCVDVVWDETLSKENSGLL